MTLAQFDNLPLLERDLWITRWEARQAACPECGLPPSECGDREKAWYPQRHVCLKTMAHRAAARAYEEKHKAQPFHDGTFTHWAKEYGPMTPFHYDDGVTVWVSEDNLTPDDDFI